MHSQCGLSPGILIHGHGTHNASYFGPLTIFFTVCQLGKGEKAGFRQRSFSEYMQRRLANDGSELARAGYPFNFDHLTEQVRIPGRYAALHVDTGGSILKKEIRRGSVHGDHPANANGIAERSLFRSETTNFICVYEDGQVFADHLRKD